MWAVPVLYWTSNGAPLGTYCKWFLAGNSPHMGIPKAEWGAQAQEFGGRAKVLGTKKSMNAVMNRLAR